MASVAGPGKIKLSRKSMKSSQKQYFNSYE